MAKAISDQVIVITGASSGIGRATAVAAAAQGARVVLAARNARDLEELASEIARAGGAAIAVPTDVTDFVRVQALADRAVQEFGRIDCWINNAAVSMYGAFDDVSLEDFRRIMDVNFMGQVHGAKAALPKLEETGGTLICVGSVLSDRGVPLQGAYCASKHALKGWLDSLRVELRERGSAVRVTLVKPSSINTPLFSKAKTLLGVAPQPIPPVYEPEIAASVLLRAATHRDRDAYVGGAGKFYAMLERVSPSIVDLHQLKRGFTAQRTDWPKGENDANNLWDAVEYDGGVHGEFTRGAKPRSVYNFMEGHKGALWLAGAVAGGLALRRRKWGGSRK
jgi:NAD(P)-dependent dehydrogenase (short-subunit alcohol dehydrogenase family)